VPWRFHDGLLFYDALRFHDGLRFYDALRLACTPPPRAGLFRPGTLAPSVTVRNHRV
jgi:hypothetical protein